MDFAPPGSSTNGGVPTPWLGQNSHRRRFPASQTSNTNTDAMALDRVNGKEELFVGG